MSHKAAESAGKIPDAREWLKTRHHFYSEWHWLRCFARENLLAAAAGFREGGATISRKTVVRRLERLAEEIGRQG